MSGFRLSGMFVAAAIAAVGMISGAGNALAGRAVPVVAQDPEVGIRPVILVAANLCKDERAVAQGVSNFGSVLQYVQAWYKSQVGKTFTLLKPKVYCSRRTAREWVRLSKIASDENHRYDYFNALLEEAQKHYRRVDQEISITVAFAGIVPNAWQGAAEVFDFAGATPRAASVACAAFPALEKQAPGARGEACADSVYAVAHELGHALGLSHSCDEIGGYPKNPNCENSFMQAKKPPGMIALKEERLALRGSDFLE